MATQKNEPRVVSIQELSGQLHQIFQDNSNAPNKSKFPSLKVVYMWIQRKFLETFNIAIAFEEVKPLLEHAQYYWEDNMLVWYLRKES